MIESTIYYDLFYFKLLLQSHFMASPLLYSLPIMAITGSFDISKLKKGKKENWLDKNLQEMTKGSVAKEMAIGGVSGW